MRLPGASKETMKITSKYVTYVRQKDNIAATKQSTAMVLFMGYTDSINYMIFPLCAVQNMDDI